MKSLPILAVLLVSCVPPSPPATTHALHSPDAGHPDRLEAFHATDAGATVGVSMTNFFVDVIGIPNNFHVYATFIDHGTGKCLIRHGRVFNGPNHKVKVVHYFGTVDETGNCRTEAFRFDTDGDIPTFTMMGDRARFRGPNPAGDGVMEFKTRTILLGEWPWGGNSANPVHGWRMTRIGTDYFYDAATWIPVIGDVVEMDPNPSGPAPDAGLLGMTVKPATTAASSWASVVVEDYRPPPSSDHISIGVVGKVWVAFKSGESLVPGDPLETCGSPDVGLACEGSTAPFAVVIEIPGASATVVAAQLR